MGLYNSADIGKPLSNARRTKKQSDLEDPNSSASIRKTDTAGEALIVEPRKKLADMTLEEQIERGKEKILDFLTYAPRTRHELSEKLSKKGFRDIAIEKALDRMEEVGVVDDAKFAQDWAYSRFHYGNRAPYIIARELGQKGLSEDHIQEALAQFDSEDIIREKAISIAETKKQSIRKSKSVLDEKDVQKIAAQLARKGFPPQICFEVAREVADASLGGDIDAL